MKNDKTYRTRMLRTWRRNRVKVDVDYVRGCVKVDRVAVSFELFKQLGDAANAGQVFRLVKAADEFGSVTLETVREVQR